jgi:hypothetical protein
MLEQVKAEIQKLTAQLEESAKNHHVLTGKLLAFQEIAQTLAAAGIPAAAQVAQVTEVAEKVIEAASAVISA